MASSLPGFRRSPGGDDGSGQTSPSTGIGVPAPAQYNSPSNPPGSQTRGTAMVVVQSVDNPTTPKYANVLVGDKIPAEAGYAIPIGMGPWTVGGISTTSTTAVAPGSVTITPISMTGISVGDMLMCSNSDNTNPELVEVTATTSNTFTATFTSAKSGTWNIASGGFTYNNSDGKGGSLMLADLDERVIKSGPYGVSTVAPTPYYSAIADHKHDGNLNPGGYLNPNPIDTGQLMTMPSAIKNAGPNITGSSLGSPVATGNSVVHQPFTVSIGDWTAGNNPLWFTAMRVYKRAHGDTHVVPVGSLPPLTNSVTWNYAVDLGVGSTGWDIGFSYVDTASFESTVVWPAALSNIDNPTTMGIIPSMPSGATISASSVTTTVFDNGKAGVSNPNLLQPVIQVQFTLVETNNPDASQWGSQFIAYVRQNGTTTWQPQSQSVLPASAFTNGSVHTVYLNVTDGNNYDVAVLLADQQGNLTNSGTPVVLASNVSVSNAIIGNPRMQQMPSTILTNGPTISTSSLVSRTIFNGTSQVVKASFTETDFTTLPDWIDAIWLQLRINGSTDATNHKRIDPSSSTTGSYTGSVFCGVGDKVDIGVFYTDKKGQQSATVWPTGMQSSTDPNGDFSDPTTGTIKHPRHSGPVTATIDPSPGGDGSYLGAGKVFGRHLSGAPSSDTGPVSDNTGKLLHTRHSGPVQNTIGSSSGSDGSYLSSSQISRRHFSSFGTGTNLLFNANGAQNLQGWSIFGTPGGTANWYPDSYSGGRFHCSRSGTTATADYILYQEFTPTAGGNVTFYGLYETDGMTLGGGGGVWIDVYDTVSATVLASTTALTANSPSTAWSITANTTAGHAIQLRFRTQFTTGDAYFYKPKAEYGTISTPFDDGWTSGIIPLTHDTSGNLDVSRAQSGKILPQANHDPGVVLGAVTGTSKNLIPDSDFIFGLGNGYWYASDSALTISPNYGGGGGNMVYYQQGASAVAIGYHWVATGLVYLQNGNAYTMSCYINNAQSSSGSIVMQIYDTNIGTGYNTLTQPAGASGRISTTFTWSNPTGNYRVIFDTTNATVNANQIIVWSEPQLEVGGYMTAYTPNIGTAAGWNVNYWPYGIHHPSFTGNFDSGGNWTKSSSFKSVLPCFQPFTTDATIAIVFSSGSAPYTAYYSVYGASGVATNCTFYNPDNTSQSAPYLGTSATAIASMINSGYSANGGAAVYYMFYYKPGDSSGVNGTGWHVSFQGTQYTATQIKTAYQDGGYIAVIATTSGGGITASSGGTGTAGGCPEETQIIERLNSLTGDIEYVEARQLRQGDFLRDPIDQCWNKILKPITISEAQIWEVTIAGETVKVDGSHLFMDAEDKWVNVQTLQVGHKMHVYPGGTGAVEFIRCIGPGRFVHISCERMRYVLGKTVSHNVKQK